MTPLKVSSTHSVTILAGLEFRIHTIELFDKGSRTSNKFRNDIHLMFRTLTL